MKIKVDKLIFISIIFHLISTQGILTYLFFDLFGIWEMKSAIHPISMALLILSFTLKFKNLKMRYEDMVFAAYAVFLTILLLYNAKSFFSFYIGFREVFVIFILSFFLSQYQFTEKQYNYLSNFLGALLIVNLIMVFLTYYLGPEAYMKMLTGRYQWGVDEVTKFKISSFIGGFWRPPGAVGSSGGLAYFALFSYFIFDLKSNQNFKKLLAFTLLLSSFTRSAMLCLVIYEGLKYLSFRRNFEKLIKYGKYFIPILILAAFLGFKNQVFSLESLYMRFDIWANDISVDYNFLYGGAIGEVGGSIRGQGFEAILDNYWLFLLYSTGLLGILIWLVFFYEKSKSSRKKFLFTFGIVCSGGFVLISQSIPFLVMFPIIFANFKTSANEH